MREVARKFIAHHAIGQATTAADVAAHSFTTDTAVDVFASPSTFATARRLAHLASYRPIDIFRAYPGFEVIQPPSDRDRRYRVTYSTNYQAAVAMEALQNYLFDRSDPRSPRLALE